MKLHDNWPKALSDWTEAQIIKASDQIVKDLPLDMGDHKLPWKERLSKRFQLSGFEQLASFGLSEGKSCLILLAIGQKQATEG